jgi:hypothetical protein
MLQKYSKKLDICTGKTFWGRGGGGGTGRVTQARE